VINTFEEKWKHNKDLAFNETLREGSKIQNWILNRNGFTNLNEFKSYLSNKKTILDAGCGNGRVTALMARCNPYAQIIGIDMYPEVAKENLRDYSNIKVIQVDLDVFLDPPERFDFIYCQEVLHHLKNPKESFHNLCTLLKSYGEIAIYVYKKKAFVRELVDEAVRAKIKDLQYNEAMKELNGITELGKALQEINIKIKVPHIPILEITEGEYTLHDFIYNFFCKCYYNEELGMDGSKAINFDWYHPTISSKHTIVEVREWFEKEGLDIIHENVDPYGITMRGVKR